MALIDLSNYAASLYQSSASRAGTPDGNFFFNTTTGVFELIASDELATFVITDTSHPAYTDGTTPISNPLDRADGIKFEAIYAFENERRANNETLRQFDRFTAGSFKFAGAYSCVNGRTPSLDSDRKIIRSSGWKELDASGNLIRIYFGARGLGAILGTSQPYYQLSEQGASVDFTAVGQIDEAVLVYRDDNGDGTPDEDNRTYMATSIRTYGQNHDRKDTVNDLGIAELGDFYSGFALSETVHLTTDPVTNHPLADVYTVPSGVWVGMELNAIAAPVAKTGEFSDETGTRLFSWELINNNSANLDQMVAWLDAFAASTDEADGLAVLTGHLGKDIETWYYYNAAGQVVTKSGVDPTTEGLYLNNIPVADQQRVVMTDDSGVIKAYSFQVSVEAETGPTAKADVNAWYHSFFAAAYNTGAAVTVVDSSAQPVKGLASTADANNKIIFGFDYTGDTLGGPADSDKNCVFLCEGDGGATQAKTLYTILKQTTVAFACIPGVETNV